MITFNSACEIALKYYDEKFGIKGICQPYDIGSAWVFNGGKEDETLFGVQKIAVSKKDGSISPFTLPSRENFALLSAGTELELPEAYR